MPHLARIAARLYNTPLLLAPETAMLIADALADRFAGGIVEPIGEAEMSRFRGRPAGPRREDGSQANYYRLQEGGVAVIPVMGELVNRGAWIGASSGLVSYEGLDAQLRAALDDPNVKSIVLDMDTPGGEASGAMETGALVRRIAEQKPVVAFVNGLAASAGYAIASGAGKIVTTPSGVLGSIGVVMLHMDRSAQLARAGVKPTLIHAGAYKVDFSPLGALGDDAKARIQASVDEIYGLFVATVVGHRSMMSERQVRATEGGVLMGSAAVRAGLADEVGTFDQILASLQPTSPFGGVTFPGAGMTTETISKADHDLALANAAQAATTAATAAATAAQTRVQTILTSPEAEGREAQARVFAFETALPADQAIKLLAAGAKQVPAAQPGRMGAVPTPAVLPDPPEDPAGAAASATKAWGGIVDGLNREAAAQNPAFRMKARQ